VRKVEELWFPQSMGTNDKFPYGFGDGGSGE